MVTLSVMSLRGCGHGYAMAGGEMLSAAVGNGARGRARAREKRGKEEGPTTSLLERTTRPGTVWMEPIVDGDLGCPR